MQVVQGLVDIGTRSGVKYRYSSSVSRIQLSKDRRRATGVVLDSGEKLTADVVVCNADLVYAYNNLLPSSTYAKSLRKRPGSCSSISFYWALNKEIPELEAHNIFLADEYRPSFDKIFKEQTLPDEPSFYVNVPSRVDPTAAPEGKDAVVVLCPVGHLLEPEIGRGLNPQTTQDWKDLVDTARKAVLSTISKRLGVDLRKHITHEMLNTPHTWRDRFNLDKGAILGLSHSFFNVLSFRPKTMHPEINDLYFVGASTHPGTGVPIVLAGSKITAEQILKHFKMQAPWQQSKRGQVASETTKSDLGTTESSTKSFEAVQKALMLPICVLLAIIGFRMLLGYT